MNTMTDKVSDGSTPLADRVSIASGLADQVSVAMAGFRPVAILVNGMKYARDRASDTYVAIGDDRVDVNAVGGRIRGPDVPWLVERGAAEVLVESDVDDPCEPDSPPGFDEGEPRDGGDIPCDGGCGQGSAGGGCG